MKKKTTAGILATGVLACSLTAGGLSLIGADAEVVGNAAQEWLASGNAVEYAADGFVEIGGAGWGAYAQYNDKVKIDGLIIQMDVSNFVDNSFGGFYFGNDSNSYFGTNSPITFTHWQNREGWGTNRFSVSANHDSNGPQLIYLEPECTTAGFGYNELTFNMIMNIVPETHYTISFDSYNETVYKVRIALSDENVLHTAHPNYGAEGGSYYCDGYIKKETIASVVDENGCTMVSFSIPNESGRFKVKLSDENIRAYQTEKVAPATEKVTAYEDAEITDDASYAEAMEKRTAALTAVNELKAREKAELTERITAVDAEYKTNTTVQTVITGIVQDKIDDAKAAFDAIFTDESTLSSASIAAANEKVKDAEEEYADKQAMLSDDNAATLEDGIDAINYASQRLSVLEWIVGYETSIANLDITSETIGTDIAAVKAVKAAFAGSNVETTLNGLADAHKTAYANRIASADSALAEKEDSAADAVKTAYVVAFENALEDLSSYSKITAAFEQKDVLEANVTLTAEDGELFTRYNTGVETLYTALETFVKDAIDSVSTALDGKFDTLTKFESVRSDYNAITLELLDADRAATATVTEAYNALTEKLKANVWYYFAQTGMSKMEQNEKGIYFEQPAPAFPARINYNKKLDLTKGAEVVVELTSMAYYNGDKTDDGASKGANNLSINFSNDPNSYKSMSSGINIIVWLFEVESNVQIMSPADNILTNGVIATPLNGGNLTISIKHGMYEDFVAEEKYPAYIITVNGVELVLSDELAEANGLDVNDEVYFSMGSFADYKGDSNCFTLISIDGESFAAKAEEPNPNPTPNPTPDSKPDDKSNIGLIVGLSVAGGVIVLAGVAVAVVFVLKKKKSKANKGNEE